MSASSLSPGTSCGSKRSTWKGARWSWPHSPQPCRGSSGAAVCCTYRQSDPGLSSYLPILGPFFHGIETESCPSVFLLFRNSISEQPPARNQPSAAGAGLWLEASGRVLLSAHHFRRGSLLHPSLLLQLQGVKNSIEGEPRQRAEVYVLSSALSSFKEPSAAAASAAGCLSAALSGH